MTYTYKGDHHTDPALKGKTCTAVRNDEGKCKRGRNSNMLVEFPEIGKQYIVNARMLRKKKTQ